MSARIPNEGIISVAQELDSSEWYTEVELERLGYARHSLSRIFGDAPIDSMTSDAPMTMWRRDHVHAIERDVLAPAAQQIFTAFAPGMDIRIAMLESNQSVGWAQMENMLTRVLARQSVESAT